MVRRFWWVGIVVPVLLLVGLAFWAWKADQPRRERTLAEAETRDHNWPEALEHWRAVNWTDQADARSWLGEARACLALDLAAQAEAALRRTVAARPEIPEGWLLWLAILRVEDRPLEALDVGWAAAEAVPPDALPEVLRALTLILLAEPPDDQARATLQRWLAADPDDREARVALLRRAATNPRDGDPNRAERIAILSDLLERYPNAISAREALVLDLADAGAIARGRAVLAAWPTAQRDVRYLRLRGRWDLEYDDHPARAAEAFRQVLEVLPHDWKTRYRLARALKILERPAEARAEAEQVEILREALDPSRLGPRLEADLDARNDPDARRDLADLCARVGLTRLADAWRHEAERSLDQRKRPPVR